jgi:hypothetical protein
MGRSGQNGLWYITLHQVSQVRALLFLGYFLCFFWLRKHLQQCKRNIGLLQGRWEMILLRALLLLQLWVLLCPVYRTGKTTLCCLLADFIVTCKYSMQRQPWQRQNQSRIRSEKKKEARCKGVRLLSTCSSEALQDVWFFSSWFTTITYEEEKEDE